jgi:hypothetical protein
VSRVAAATVAANMAAGWKVVRAVQLRVEIEREAEEARIRAERQVEQGRVEALRAVMRKDTELMLNVLNVLNTNTMSIPVLTLVLMAILQPSR